MLTDVEIAQSAKMKQISEIAKKVGLEDDEKYDYSRPDLWEYIQYLPKELGNTQFYVPWMNSNYEKALAENYRRILKHGRTSDIKKLNQQNK